MLLRSQQRVGGWWHQLAAVFCVLVLLFSLNQACCAVEVVQEPVRVGYYFDADYMHKDPGGIYKGYNMEYLYELANYANWQYRFTDYDSFESAYGALAKGEIDLLPALFFSPERAETFLLSAKNMGQVYVTLVVREDDELHAFNDYAAFDGMRVGVLSQSLDSKAFLTWAGEHKLHVQLSNYESVEELCGALDQGRVDAVAVTYLGSNSKYRIVAEFSPMPLYFAVNRQHPEIKGKLNQAMEALNMENPGFQTALVEKYLMRNKRQKPVFTRPERALLEQKKPVRVAMQLDNAPFCFEDDKGQLQGVVPDLFHKLAQISGLQFEYLKAPDMLEAIRLVEEGKADVVGKLTADSALAMRHNLRLSRSYMDNGITQVTLKGTTRIKVIGVPDPLRGLFTDTIMGSDDKPALLSSFPNSDACFNALKTGTIDAAFLNSVSANYYLNNNRISDFNFSSLPSHSHALVLGTRLGGDPVLYSLLNKSLGYVEKNYLEELSLKYSLRPDTSLAGLLSRVPQHFLVGSSIFLLVLVIGLALLILTLVRHARVERELSAEKEHVRRQNEELRLAQAADSNRMQFFGTVSHDMRTPLNGILGFTDLALQAESLPEVKSFLEKIKISGKLLLNLVNDTLTLSKLANDKYPLHLEPVDLEQLWNSITVPVHSLASAKNVALDLDFTQCEFGYFQVDKLNFQKIFLNLLTNAVKFTPAGGKVTLRVHSTRADDGANSCIVTVEDTGIGISAKFLPKIYDAFSQEPQHRNVNTSGTGLGLSIVKRLVEAMQGQITVASTLGKGTKFTVQLPLQRAQDYEPEDQEQVDLSLLAGKTVLVCEDNQMNMEILQRILHKQKMEVLTAVNGLEGLKLFTNSGAGKIDLVLMDIRMPVMDGYTATRAIRGLTRTDAQTVPILALSADAYDEDVLKGKRVGMNGHLAKPIDPKLLYAALVQALTRPKQV